MRNYLKPQKVGVLHEDVQIECLRNGSRLKKPLDVRVFRHDNKGPLYCAKDLSLDGSLQGWGHTSEMAVIILTKEYDDLVHSFVKGSHRELFREIDPKTWEKIQDYVEVPEGL